jgi:DNA ligase 1
MSRYETGVKGGVFYCSCLSWKYQNIPINQRTCKHLIEKYGKQHEMERVPDSFLSKQSKYKLNYKSKSKTNSKNKFNYKSKTKNDENKKPKNNSFIHPLLFHKLDDEQYDLSNWFYSIKLNGAFVRWDGQCLLSKTGRVLQNVPKYITENLPPHIQLDGELYAGKQKFTSVLQCINGFWPSNNIHVYFFDIPDLQSPFQERLKTLKKLKNKFGFKIVTYKRLPLEDFQSKLSAEQQKVIKNHEEGLVFKKPDEMYKPGKRVYSTLKWKPTFYSKGTILEIYNNKRGKGILVYENETNVSFKLNVHNSKLKNFKIGDTVIFSYSGRHENNKPEIAKFIE